MPAGEFVRWCAFLRMQSDGGGGGGGSGGNSPTTGGGKIGKFRSKLNKGGFYRHIGYRK